MLTDLPPKKDAGRDLHNLSTIFEIGLKDPKDVATFNPMNNHGNVCSLIRLTIGQHRPLLKGSTMTEIRISDQIKASIVIARDAFLARRASLRTITYSDLSGIEAANEAVSKAVATLLDFGTGDRCGWSGGSATGQEWAYVFLNKYGTVAERRELRATNKALNSRLLDSIPSA